MEHPRTIEKKIKGFVFLQITQCHLGKNVLQYISLILNTWAAILFAFTWEQAPLNSMGFTSELICIGLRYFHTKDQMSFYDIV